MARALPKVLAIFFHLENKKESNENFRNVKEQ